MEFEFPDTGEGVTEGQFLDWLVDEGEEVEEDQAVAEVETDKAVVDIPAPSDGRIEELKAEPGDTVKVGQVIMILDVEEEPAKAEDETEETKLGETSKKEVSSPEYSSSSEDVLALPKVRKLARDKGVDLASIKTGERITEEEVLDAAGEQTAVQKTDEASGEETETEHDSAGDTSEVLATPSVRKLAREKEIDITSVEGSGRGGKVTREDVLNVPGGGQKANNGGIEVPASPSSERKGEKKRVEMSNIRKTVADRMEKSRFTAPHVTHVEKADVTKLVELRNEEKDKVDVHLTYLPFIMKALKIGLEKYPNLNAELDEENDEIVQYYSYDFNVAVDTDNGLMVPRIDSIDEKSIVELAGEITEKAGKAKNGELSGEEMENGTFSITNLGVIGGEEFTPIINYPQAAILGVGKIQETAEVVDGEVTPRWTVKLSLSYDHRVVDGAEAARFMNEVVENLEDPEKMMISL